MSFQKALTRHPKKMAEGSSLRTRVEVPKANQVRCREETLTT
ncbi:Uncharacterized protein APZ42_018940 [Daphnia magna]|uniref:Uncharacterized protein n=1 Tax=Daphnia magna TaxID=35525 RepID=A0A164YX94_9CRUS|nr:Uncharacterized protein APZ42_018940 [Daphnia magna]